MRGGRRVQRPAASAPAERDPYAAGPEGGQPDALLPYQRRNILHREFDRAHWHVVSCCANDSIDMTDQEMLRNMRNFWMRRHDRLVADRERFQKQLQAEADSRFGHDAAATAEQNARHDRLELDSDTHFPGLAAAGKAAACKRSHRQQPQPPATSSAPAPDAAADSPPKAPAQGCARPLRRCDPDVYCDVDEPLCDADCWDDTQEEGGASGARPLGSKSSAARSDPRTPPRGRAAATGERAVSAHCSTAPQSPREEGPPRAPDADSSASSLVECLDAQHTAAPSWPSADRAILRRLAREGRGAAIRDSPAPLDCRCRHTCSCENPLHSPQPCAGGSERADQACTPVAMRSPAAGEGHSGGSGSMGCTPSPGTVTSANSPPASSSPTGSALPRGKKGKRRQVRNDLLGISSVPILPPSQEDAEGAPRAQQAPDATHRPQAKKGGIVFQTSMAGALAGRTRTVSGPRGPAVAGNWAARAAAARTLVPQRQLSLRVEQILPGIVVLRNAIPPEAQQHFWDLSVRIGTPSDGLSGGWYKVEKDGRLRWNHGSWGQMHEPMATFPRQYRQMHAYYLKKACELDSTLPYCDANLVLSNFYPPNSSGIYWHRDNSVNQTEAVRRQLPVVSFSIGHSAEFGIRTPIEIPEGSAAAAAEKDSWIVLNSGDVLVFGGPARKVKHCSREPFKSSQHQRGLNQVDCEGEAMPGRLNLTFRQQEGPWE